MELSEQIVLIFGLAGISKEDIPLSFYRSFRPRDILGKIRGLIDEDARTDIIIQNARNLNLQIFRTFSAPGVRRISEEEKCRVKSIIRRFICKVREISRSHSQKPPKFSYQLLAKCCERFISEFNCVIAELDNKWLCQYGIIHFQDLAIQDCNHLASIVREALDAKLIPKDDRKLAKGFLMMNSANEALKTWKLTLKRPQVIRRRLQNIQGVALHH